MPELRLHFTPLQTVLRIGLGALVLAAAADLRAEESGESTATRLEPVEVSAERLPLEETLSPGVVSVVYPDDVKGEHKSLPELLDQIPGVYVRRVAGTGQYTTASIRGSAPSQVNIYIDGVPFNLSSEAAADLSTIPISNVERVEVYRGTTPARFSGAPLGGAINIVTKTPQGIGGSISAGMRSHGGRQASSSISAPLLTGSLLIGIDTDRSVGDFKYEDLTVRRLDGIVHGNGTRPTKPVANPNIPVARHRMNNDSQKDNMLVKWQNSRLVAKWAYTYMDRAMPTPISTNPSYSDHQQDLPWTKVSERNRQKQAQHDVVLGWNEDFGDLTLGVNLNYLNQKKIYRNEDNQSVNGVGRSWSHYQTRRYGGAVDATYALGHDWPLSHLFEIHAERYRETLHADASQLTATSDFVRQFGRRMTRIQAQNTITVGFLDDLLITPVGRLERLDGPTIGSRWSPTGGASGDYGWKPTGGISAKKYLPGGWQVYGSFGTYNRYPNFYEIYGDGINVVPNADSTGKAVPLQREFGRNSDIGTGWDGKITDDLSGGFRLTYFERKTENTITNYATPLAAKYVNSGDTYQHGAEIEGNLSWGSRADLQLAVTRQEGWYRNGGWYYFGGTPSSARAGDITRTLNAPLVSADIRLNLHFLEGALTTYFEVKHSGRKYIDTEMFERPLTTFDTGLHYKFPAGLRLSAGVTDLFNQGPKQSLYGAQEHTYTWRPPRPSGVSYADWIKYYTVNERYGIDPNVMYPQQGRTIYATLTWTF